MGYPDRVTVCISSQAGCAMGCTFCATGQMGLQNNLTAGEIAAQVVWARREAARLPDAHAAATHQRRVHGDGGADREPAPRVRAMRSSPTQPRSASARGTSRSSTVGIVPGIERLAERAPQVGLAVSFHAASDELRDELVPPNTRYPLAKLERAIADWRAEDPPPPLDRVGDDRRVNDTDRAGRAARTDRAPARRARQPHPAEPDAGLPGTGLATEADPDLRRRAGALARQRHGSRHAGSFDRRGLWPARAGERLALLLLLRLQLGHARLHELLHESDGQSLVVAELDRALAGHALAELGGVLLDDGPLIGNRL